MSTLVVRAIPTAGIYEVPLRFEQGKVPLRIWDAVSVPGGIPIDLYVFSVVPKHDEDGLRFRALLPDYMQRSNVIHAIDIERAQREENCAHKGAIVYALDEKVEDRIFNYCPDCGLCLSLEQKEVLRKKWA